MKYTTFLVGKIVESRAHIKDSSRFQVARIPADQHLKENDELSWKKYPQPLSHGF